MFRGVSVKRSGEEPVVRRLILGSVIRAQDTFHFKFNIAYRTQVHLNSIHGWVNAFHDSRNVSSIKKEAPI